MEVEYKKDLHHNYMVINDRDDYKSESYCIKMLSYQSLEGLLKVERRTIDNLTLFYYEITSKQSISNLFSKSALSYGKVKGLFLEIIKIIEKAYEYLLVEDDFILSPEYIYMDVISEKPYLCYYSGYRTNIVDQMSCFIEYIMNKVDYNDKEAVLLTYSLYAVSKKEGFTFNHLLEVLHKKSHSLLTEGVKSIEGEPFEKLRLGEIGKEKAHMEREKTGNNNEISVMMEKVEGEKELAYFPLMTYLYTALCFVGGFLVLGMAVITKTIYNSFGNRIDFSKLFAVLLLLVCVCGYLLKNIWDKKNQITKMVMKHEYIDPRHEYEKAIVEEEKGSLPLTTLNSFKKVKVEESEEYNPTCLLNDVPDIPNYILKPTDEEKYNNIIITEFPFFIGKLKKNVDYCLEKDVVSRYHAKLSKEQEGFYLTDLNSTNGTYLNKEALQTYQKKEIKIGDEIAFANIKYLFLLDGNLK